MRYDSPIGLVPSLLTLLPPQGAATAALDSASAVPWRTAASALDQTLASEGLAGDGASGHGAAGGSSHGAPDESATELPERKIPSPVAPVSSAPNASGADGLERTTEEVLAPAPPYVLTPPKPRVEVSSKLTPLLIALPLSTVLLPPPLTPYVYLVPYVPTVVLSNPTAALTPARDASSTCAWRFLAGSRCPVVGGGGGGAAAANC
mmetsp:Transcript_6400/g.11093  ORF Transcript_6400/g.11093 Transcript_6400/m.11093 type:complete len:206 (-) Transcript_6400:108-725(-)